MQKLQTARKRAFSPRRSHTGAPCTKKDTVNTKGKHGEAGTRQIRVILFGEYEWLDKNDRPIPFKNSFSYAVSGEEIAEASGLVTTVDSSDMCSRSMS